MTSPNVSTDREVLTIRSSPCTKSVTLHPGTLLALTARLYRAAGHAISNNAGAAVQLLSSHRVLKSVKTFFKIVLIVIAAVIAVKLLPITLALGLALGLAAVGLAIAGVSIVAALLVAAIFIAGILSPIWVPVLLLVGLIALIKRVSRGPAAPA
jgi:hypothetical protein